METEGKGQAGKEQTAAAKRRIRKTRDGVVLSNKMAKTIVVAVTRQIRHKQYGKIIRRTRKFYAHDEKGTCGVGDVVRIVETKPISKLKNWRLKEVLVKAE